jgi:uncharacterized membrane protein (DUF2068 family)
MEQFVTKYSPSFTVTFTVAAHDKDVDGLIPLLQKSHRSLTEGGSAMTVSRPMGATLLALLGIVQGLFWTFNSLTTLALGILDMSAGQTDQGASYVYLSVPMLILGLFTLVLSYGLWNVRPWAWMWMLMTQVLGLVLELIPLFYGQIALVGLVSIAISILIIVYLLTPGVRAAYLR